jgi:hypothetical protein
MQKNVSRQPMIKPGSRRAIVLRNKTKPTTIEKPSKGKNRFRWEKRSDTSGFFSFRKARSSDCIYPAETTGIIMPNETNEITKRTRVLNRRVGRYWVNTCHEVSR